MSIENEQVAPENLPEQAATPPAAPQQMFSQEDLEKAFTVRIKKERENHEKEKEELKKKLNELEKKVMSGKANQSENLEYQAGVSAASKAKEMVAQNMMPIDQVDQYISEAIKEEKYSEKIHDAIQKDPEFKQLIEQNGQKPQQEQRINRNEAMLLSDLKNSTAVLKHLLKDDKDYQIFKAAEGNINNDGGVTLIKFIHELSDKLGENAKQVKPNTYSPVPNVADIGASDDFDEAEYIKNRY